MIEKWRQIDEFPRYRISDQGRVLNIKFGNIMKEGYNRQGITKVNLLRDGIQYTRSVALLVAEAFVPGRTGGFNTPIHLDCDQRNNWANNLAWRTRRFALSYCKQFDDLENLIYEMPIYNEPIFDLETGEPYENFIDAAKTNGFLMSSLLHATTTHQPIFPTGQRFAFLD